MKVDENKVKISVKIHNDVRITHLNIVSWTLLLLTIIFFMENSYLWIAVFMGSMVSRACSYAISCGWIK